MCAFFLHLFIAQLSKQFYWFKHLFISLRSANIFIFRMNSCSSYIIHNCQKLLTLYSANNIFFTEIFEWIFWKMYHKAQPAMMANIIKIITQFVVRFPFKFKWKYSLLFPECDAFFTIEKKNWANKEEKKWTHPISMIVRLFEILETFLQRKLSYGEILDWIRKLFLES